MGKTSKCSTNWWCTGVVSNINLFFALSLRWKLDRWLKVRSLSGFWDLFFFSPLFLSSSSTCMTTNGNVIQVHHRFARRKFSQLVAVNTSETGYTDALFSFPEASSSRARSLYFFFWFWFCFFVFFLKKGEHLVGKNPGLGPATLSYNYLLVSRSVFELSVLSLLLLL